MAISFSPYSRAVVYSFFFTWSHFLYRWLTQHFHRRGKICILYFPRVSFFPTPSNSISMHLSIFQTFFSLPALLAFLILVLFSYPVLCFSRLRSVVILFILPLILTSFFSVSHEHIFLVLLERKDIKMKY